MKTKSLEVNVLGLKPSMFEVLGIIELCCQIANGDNYQVTITSAKDGVHSPGSLHYVGLAVDIRTKDMKDISLSVKWLDKFLNVNGKKFDVVFEIDHIHIELDEKK